MTLVSQRTKIPGVRTVIGIVSGKGGVGKTFASSSLAVTLAKLGKKVGVLDADINCPDIFSVLGIGDKLKVAEDKKIIPAEKWGIYAVSMAGLTETPDEAIVWRGPILSKIIQQLLKETLWGELDYLIIDFPTGTSDIVLTTLQNFAVDGLLIVTTPQPVSILATQRCLHMASMLQVPVLGLIENMRGEIFGEGGTLRICDRFQTMLLGSIPLRKHIVNFCDAGTPPVLKMEELEMIFGKISRTLIPVFS